MERRSKKRKFGYDHVGQRAVVTMGGTRAWVPELDDPSASIPLVETRLPLQDRDSYAHQWMPSTPITFRAPRYTFQDGGSLIFRESDAVEVQRVDAFLRRTAKRLLLDHTPLSESVSGICASYVSLAPGWMYQLKDILPEARTDMDDAELYLAMLPITSIYRSIDLPTVHVLAGVLGTSVRVWRGAV